MTSGSVKNGKSSQVMSSVVKQFAAGPGTWNSYNRSAKYIDALHLGQSEQAACLQKDNLNRCFKIAKPAKHVRAFCGLSSLFLTVLKFQS